jgi:hypothetical protein
MKSTSISRSRQASRYSTLLVRTITRAVLESLRASIAATRFASSRGLQAITRPASSMPASRITRLVVPLPSTVRTS